MLYDPLILLIVTIIGVYTAGKLAFSKPKKVTKKILETYKFLEENKKSA